jgi:hypothetical protein
MQYYVAQSDGSQIGPIDENQLLGRGVTANTLLWREGMADWKPAGQITELGYLFNLSQPAVQQQYPQQQFNPQSMPPEPSNHLALSIIVTVLCCLPFGIVGIINATKVNSYYMMGNYAAAEKASKDAKKWSMIGIICSAVVWLIYILLYVFIFAAIGFSDFK